MSIIHDALKKVQANLQSSQAHPTPILKPAAPPQAQAVPTAPVLQPKKSFYLLIACLVLLSTAIAGYYLFSRLSTPRTEATPIAQNKAESTAAQTVAPPIIKPAIVSAPEPIAAPVVGPVATPPSSPERKGFKVEGIMNTPTGSAALIDGKIYEVGDDLDGAKIIKIEENSVTFSDNGSETTIKVGH